MYWKELGDMHIYFICPVFDKKIIYFLNNGARQKKNA